ncbi:AAA domain [Trypanosoma vivax]|nr:PIF1 helicase-like protein [Trypanosoma vivax]KAH8603536.1 AAA domain [Trypanosoma vivax]
MFSFTIGVLRRAARWSASPTTRPKAAHRPCNVRSRRTEQKSAVSTNNDIPVLSADTTPRPAGTYTLAEESLPSVRVPTEIPEDVHVSSVVETNATQIAERDTDLAPEKQKVLQLAMDGASLFISGDAGTGKSYLLKCIIEALELNGLRVAVTASTGLAALRIGGNTFHATFGIPVNSVEERKKAGLNPVSHLWINTKILAELDVIIIDEVSLLHAGFIEALDCAARRTRGKVSYLPFGGIQLILSGDFMQLTHDGVGKKDRQKSITCMAVDGKYTNLPGVCFGQLGSSVHPTPAEDEGHAAVLTGTICDNKHSSDYSCPPIFECPQFLHCLVHIRLTVKMRHLTDPEFVKDLKQLRQGVLTSRLARCAAINPEDPNALRLFPTKRAVAAYNDAKILALSGKEHCFRTVLRARSSTRSKGEGMKGQHEKISTDVLVIHFRSKLQHSSTWRTRAELLVQQLCEERKLAERLHIIMSPSLLLSSRHLVVYVRFTERTKGDGLRCILALRAAISEKMSGRAADTLALRRQWGNVFTEIRHGDQIVRNLWSAFERQYFRCIGNETVLQHKRLKVDCRVMLLRNLSVTYVNGSLGTVVRFEALDNVCHLVPADIKLKLSPEVYACLGKHHAVTNKTSTPPQNAPPTGEVSDRGKHDSDDESVSNDKLIVPVVRMDADGKEIAVPWVSQLLPAECMNGFGQVCAITMPLTPAYAFTVHKVQGLTFDSPILLDCEKFFPCDHLIYVAASRVRRFSQLRMINISCRMVSVDSNALQFSSAIPVVEDAVQNWVKWKKSKTKIEQRKASPGSSPTPELLTLYRATWRSRSP